jgi:hypothetical protein
VRIYRGRCLNNDYIDGSIDRFRAIRNNIFALIETQDGLTRKVRDLVADYVQQFYDIADDPRRVRRVMTKKCI